MGSFNLLKEELDVRRRELILIVWDKVGEIALKRNLTDSDKYFNQTWIWNCPDLR